MRCHARNLLLVLALALLLGGCATTYIPISWGMGERVQHLSREDLTLSILFERYDPKRQTLRVSGASFDEVMMPSEVKHHLGAYRPDTKIIYRNMYQEFTDQGLRDLMLHELSHHIWFNYMSTKQRADWMDHLDQNPTPLRNMVRRVYEKETDHDAEDFAFSIEYARPLEIEVLCRMNLITTDERDKILAKLKPGPAPAPPAAAPPKDHKMEEEFSLRLPSTDQNRPRPA